MLVAATIVVAAHHLVSSGQHADRGVVLAVAQKLIKFGLKLGEVDCGRVVVFGVSQNMILAICSGGREEKSAQEMVDISTTWALAGPAASRATARTT
jgi:hypothetical protein